MILDTAAIRRAAQALPGDVVGMTKQQLEQLLDAVEGAQGQRTPARG